jgi:hypothetical protein
MASATPSPLHRQIARVSRRLFLQTLLDSLAWCWAGAFLLAAVWFLADPLVPGDRPEGLRWWVAGGLAGLGAVLAVALAVLRAPSKLAAALSMDERFGLKERVTTSLTLPPDAAALPAAQALLEDVNDKVANLDIGSGFPVGLRWNAALVPVGGLLLAAVALFYDPTRTQATTPPADESAKAPANKAEIDQKMKELQKKAREKRETEKAKGTKADPLDDELQKVLNKKHDTNDEVRDRIKDLTALEEKIKNRQDSLAEKAQAVKDQLQQMNKAAGTDPKDGPAKELQKALQKGDFKKAEEEVERLVKKLQNNEMTQEEKEQLRKQLKDLKEKMERAADPSKEDVDKLQELRKQGKIDEQQLKKALDDLKKKNESKMSPEDKKKMEDLADALAQCEQGMKEGDGNKASEGLKKAAAAMRKMDDLDDLKDLDEQLEQIQDAKRCMCQGMNNMPVPAQGRRPEGDPHETRSYTTRIRGNFDPKGQKELTGYAPGTSYKKKSSAEIAGEIKQASQEAPEAIERQRIPRAATDMARGYYENLRKMSGDEK